MTLLGFLKLWNDKFKENSNKSNSRKSIINVYGTKFPTGNSFNISVSVFEVAISLPKQLFTCSKSTMETLKKGVKYVQKQQ